jgi:hypothetical protein
MCPTGEQADSGGRQGWQHYSFFCGDAQSRVSHKLGLDMTRGGGAYRPPLFSKNLKGAQV